MAGAAKNRAKKDRQAAEKKKSSEDLQQAPVQQTLRAYDGPGDSSRGAPGSSGRPGSSAGPPSVGQRSVRSPSQGRGRSGSTAPPSVGQPSVRSPSRGPAPSQVRGTSSNLLPDRTALMSAARYVDLPGNAYTLRDEVSRNRFGPNPRRPVSRCMSNTPYVVCSHLFNHASCVVALPSCRPQP